MRTPVRAVPSQVLHAAFNHQIDHLKKFFSTLTTNLVCYLTVEHLLLLPSNHEDLSTAHHPNGWGGRAASNVIKTSELNRYCGYGGPRLSHRGDH